MQLALVTTFDRNATKRQALAGDLDNLRIYQMNALTALDGKVLMQHNCPKTPLSVR